MRNFQHTQVYKMHTTSKIDYFLQRQTGKTFTSRSFSSKLYISNDINKNINLNKYPH